MKKSFICLLLLFVVLSAWTMPVEAGAGSGSELDADAIDAYIAGQMSKHGIHGISSNETFKTPVDIYPLRDMSIVLLINQGYMFDHTIPDYVQGFVKLFWLGSGKTRQA